MGPLFFAMLFRVSWFDAGDLRRGLLVLGLCLAGTLCAKFAMAPYGVAALAPLSLWPALFLTRRMSLTDSALAGVLSSFFLSYLAFYWFAGALGRWLLVRCYELAEASAIQPFAYFQLVFAAAIGLLVFGESIRPEVAVGALVIVGAGLFTLWREREQR